MARHVVVAHSRTEGGKKAVKGLLERFAGISPPEAKSIDSVEGEYRKALRHAGYEAFRLLGKDPGTWKNKDDELAELVTRFEAQIDASLEKTPNPERRKGGSNDVLNTGFSDYVSLHNRYVAFTNEHHLHKQADIGDKWRLFWFRMITAFGLVVLVLIAGAVPRDCRIPLPTVGTIKGTTGTFAAPGKPNWCSDVPLLRPEKP